MKQAIAGKDVKSKAEESAVLGPVAKKQLVKTQ
jgi:hypothetical protein